MVTESVADTAKGAATTVSDTAKTALKQITSLGESDSETSLSPPPPISEVSTRRASERSTGRRESAAGVLGLGLTSKPNSSGSVGVPTDLVPGAIRSAMQNVYGNEYENENDDFLASTAAAAIASGSAAAGAAAVSRSRQQQRGTVNGNGIARRTSRESVESKRTQSSDRKSLGRPQRRSVPSVSPVRRGAGDQQIVTQPVRSQPATPRRTPRSQPMSGQSTSRSTPRQRGRLPSEDTDSSVDTVIIAQRKARGIQRKPPLPPAARRPPRPPQIEQVPVVSAGRTRDQGASSRPTGPASIPSNGHPSAPPPRRLPEISSNRVVGPAVQRTLKAGRIQRKLSNISERSEDHTDSGIVTTDTGQTFTVSAPSTGRARTKVAQTTQSTPRTSRSIGPDVSAARTRRRQSVLPAVPATEESSDGGGASSSGKELRRTKTEPDFIVADIDLDLPGPYMLPVTEDDLKDKDFVRKHFHEKPSKQDSQRSGSSTDSELPPIELPLASTNRFQHPTSDVARRIAARRAAARRGEMQSPTRITQSSKGRFGEQTPPGPSIEERVHSGCLTDRPPWDPSPLRDGELERIPLDWNLSRSNSSVSLAGGVRRSKSYGELVTRTGLRITMHEKVRVLG
ncbi:hypothetical protein AAVH_13047 [Aphelenchoides avenae]|nr:hypothetical protein AAVH_13047 [Aphelenchus avenae]